MDNNNTPSYRDVIDFIWRLRWWILGSVALALLVAFVYVRMQTPVYERSSWVMLNKNDGSNADMALLANMTGRTVQKRIDNEIFLLKSPSLMRQVVESHDLNKRYFQFGAPVANSIRLSRSLFDFKKAEFYRNSPFVATMAPADSSVRTRLPGSLYIEFKNDRAKSFTVKKLTVNGGKCELSKRNYAYGEPIRINDMDLYLTVMDPDRMVGNRDKFAFSYVHPFSAAKGFLANLSVDVSGKQSNRPSTSDVVILSYYDALPRRAEDILNTLVIKSNQEARDYANITSLNTIKFIDSRLNELAGELGAAENNYKRYQANNVVLDIDSQSQLAMSSDMSYQNQLVDVRLQLSILDMITDYLNDTPAGEYRVLPTNIGISDVGLNSIISAYNENVATRNRMVSNSSETNPRVISLNAELEDIRKSIEISIANLVRVYHIQEQELVRILGESKMKMASIPQQQFEVQQLSRKINVIEPLYLMLQEKRETAQITMYSQADNFRLIEAAFGSSTPISPKTSKIYLVALLLGLCLAPLFVWLRVQLKTKVETKDDITDKVDAPVIAVLPHAPKDFGTLIPRNGRDTVSESFRMLRANLQYLPNAQVIQVTSSTPGEGKSFVAANLALSLSHLEKKVLLMGMDIRKPVLHQTFPGCKVDKSNTMVGYLIGKCENMDDMVVPSGVSPNLDLVFAGPVPPNPTELLSQGNEGELINYFRGRYDYIVIDSAPYLPVSDSFIINTYVDITLYAIRANYTDLKVLYDINEAIHGTAKPIKNVSLILNDLDMDATKYRYGYGAGYGYGSGYGYGYGYGYGNEDTKTRKEKVEGAVKTAGDWVKSKLKK